jgi:signal transduction histidine kinase
MGSKEPVNILLVDDQPGKLLSYETILAELGENLIRANSGNEALEQLLKLDIAVVLVDVCMPELDGFELASMIRNHPRFQKTSIILVSGVLVDDVNRLKGYGAGAVDYVSVPIIPEILRAKVSVFADLFRKTEELQRLNRELEERVTARTAEIQASAARLRQSEERLRLVLTSSGIQGWTWDVRRDEVTSVMPTGGPEQNRGSLADWLADVHPDDRSAVRAAFEGALASNDEYSAEFRGLEDGAVRWFLGRGTPIRDASGEPLSIAGVNIDITERKHSEEERVQLLKNAQEARREAETANQLKDEFLATLSHELRTPLNAILGWAHLLGAGELDEANRNKAVETITRNAQLQTQLISDILDMSRITTGKLRLSLASVDLASVIQAAVDTVRPSAAAKAIQLETRLAFDGEPLHGDAARLQQVMWNLLSNAIKFTPKDGHVQVLVESVGPDVEITVQDDGPGIGTEFLPYIFDRFRQADSSSTRAHRGLGLGLSIVRHLVEMHGGSVRGTNRSDRSGAIFKFSLPRTVTIAVSADAAATPAETAAPPTMTPSLKDLRILIVDDQADAREVVATVLERYGAEARVAASASEAYAILERDRPDVLVADLEMPGEDGYALLAKVRALPPEQGGLTPAVALTAYATVQDRMKVLAAGFQVHVPKPIHPVELVTIVANLAGTAWKRPHRTA